MTSPAPRDAGTAVAAAPDQAADPVAAPAADLVAALVPHPADGPLAAARAERPDAVLGTQDTYRALFDPGAALTTLTPAERLAAALRVAVLHTAGPATGRLAGHYRAQLAALGADPVLVDAAGSTGFGPGDARTAALLGHATLLALEPLAATEGHQQALADAGLTPDEVVTLSQVAAYVSYQARLVHGLSLLAEAADGSEATDEPGAAAGPAGALGVRVPGVPPALPHGAELPSGEIPFTFDVLDWDPWVPPVDPQAATGPQQAGLAAAPDASWPYFRLLARDPEVLRHRTRTDRGIFRSPGGLPRAERELAATVASRLNGCVFCASVHSRLAARLSGREAEVERLFGGRFDGFEGRWADVVAFAARLSTSAPTASAADLERLRGHGLSVLEQLDLVQATAFFAWANRLMLTLGRVRRPVPGEAS
ncbi:peroxidase-related enzyme [Kitasatospora sp. NBC_01560]|uniref:CMD domain-containing protein n=1 Tax=Kitasatospora sp. NBC_01560 TaxID=2975965 RepID=UPI00386F7D0E